MDITNLKKRKLYNYYNNLSYISKDKTYLQYPINKFFICKCAEFDNLQTQLDLYAIDIILSNSNKAYIFLCVAFHCIQDLNNFTNAINYTHCFDIQQSRNAWTIFSYIYCNYLDNNLLQF